MTVFILPYLMNHVKVFYSFFRQKGQKKAQNFGKKTAAPIFTAQQKKCLSL